MEAVFRELYDLESRTREATDMLERSARELPEMADLLNAGIRFSDPDGAAIPADVAEDTAVDALVDALVPAPAAAGEA
jgi:hypothetical protein